MKREPLFYGAVVFTVVGFTLIGLGTGKVFNTPCEGAIIGVGVGLCVTALPLFNVFRRIDSYEKK